MSYAMCGASVGDIAERLVTKFFMNFARFQEAFTRVREPDKSRVGESGLAKFPPCGVLAVAVGICLLTFFATVPLSRIDNQLFDSDGVFYYAYLPSVLLHGSLDFTEEYRYFFAFDPALAQELVNDLTPKGLPANQWSIGPAILWSPFFVCAHLLIRLSSLLGANIPADGLNNFYQFFVLLGNILYGGAALFLTYRFVLEFVSEEVALVATVLVAFAGNLVYYMTAAPYMSHPLSAFASGLFFYTWVRKRKQPGIKTAVLYGLLGGVMALIRSQDGLLLVLPFLGRVPGAWRSLRGHGVPGEWRRWLQESLAAGVTALITFSPQMLVWGSLYGDFFRSSYLYQRDNAFDWLNPKLVQVLFSSERGLFIWHPIFLLAVLGLLLAYRREPVFSIAGLLGFAAQWYIISSWYSWFQGGAFGGRMFIVCTPIFAMGLAYLIETAFRGGFRSIVYSLGGLLLFWNFLLFVDYRFNLDYLDHLPTWFEITIGRVTFLADLIHRVLTKAYSLACPSA